MRVVIVNQQFGEGTLAGTGLTHKGRFLSGSCGKGNVVEDFILNHCRFPVGARLHCLIGKSNMVIGNGVVFSMKRIASLLKFRRIQDLLQRRNLVVKLGHGRQEPKRFEQRHTDTQGEA